MFFGVVSVGLFFLDKLGTKWNEVKTVVIALMLGVKEK